LEVAAAPARREGWRTRCAARRGHGPGVRVRGGRLSGSGRPV